MIEEKTSLKPKGVSKQLEPDQADRLRSLNVIEVAKAARPVVPTLGGRKPLFRK